jgi:non-canonical purine NTP pyrophosphatase (RdgB/HAM1 family)
VDLLIATSNAGKLREFRALLGQSGRFRYRSLTDFPQIPPPDETGRTFRANAILKATAYARATGCWALADDSGLEVEFLGGKPGVHSARWASLHNAGAGDAANNALLLRQMRGVPAERRGARFVCTLALSDPAGRVAVTTRGTVKGRLLTAAAGANGFGYDPLFFVEALGQTTAQLSAEQKHAISHRGQAIRRLARCLDRLDLNRPRA